MMESSGCKAVLLQRIVQLALECNQSPEMPKRAPKHSLSVCRGPLLGVCSMILQASRESILTQGVSQVSVNKHAAWTYQPPHNCTVRVPLGLQRHGRTVHVTRELPQVDIACSGKTGWQERGMVVLYAEESSGVCLGTGNEPAECWWARRRGKAPQAMLCEALTTDQLIQDRKSLGQPWSSRAFELPHGCTSARRPV